MAQCGVRDPLWFAETVRFLARSRNSLSLSAMTTDSGQAFPLPLSTDQQDAFGCVQRRIQLERQCSPLIQ